MFLKATCAFSGPAILRLLGLQILFGLQMVWAQSAPPDISVSGSTSAHVISENELLQFTLAIKNKADGKADGSSVQQVRLMRLPDGYILADKAQVCILPVLPPRTDACQPSKDFLDSESLLAHELAPGESLTVQGYLKPTSVHKISTLTAIVTWLWKSGASPPLEISSAQSVGLGENQVQISSSLGRWTIGDWAKNLGLPALLLAAVGFLTTLIVNRINTHAETWKQMLPVSHGYVKFYLQLSLAAQRFADNLNQSSRNGDLAFFYLLMTVKKMIATRKEIGGFYFKDIRGEVLAANCWAKQRDACLGKEHLPLFQTIRASIDQLDVDDIDAYGVFVRKYADDSRSPRTFYQADMQKAWENFRDWLWDDQRVTRTIIYLTAFYSVLDLEANRPYKHWYISRVKGPEISEAVRVKLQQILRAEGYSSREIRNYLRSFRKGSA